MALKNSRLTSPVPVDTTASFSNESTAGVPATALICSSKVLVGRAAAVIVVAAAAASGVVRALEEEEVVVARKGGSKKERRWEWRVKAVGCEERSRRRRRETRGWCWC